MKIEAPNVRKSRRQKDPADADAPNQGADDQGQN